MNGRYIQITAKVPIFEHFPTLDLSHFEKMSSGSRTCAHRLSIPLLSGTEDFNQAIDYFEEYFAEAGEENEQQAIEDLGSPEDAAKELIMNLAEKNMEQPPKTVKHSFKAVWIGILGICAAPIALPIALSLICVIAAVIVSVFCVFAGLFLTAVTLAGAAVIGVIGGAALLIQSLPDGLATLGFSLCCGAVGIMSVYGIFCFLKWLLYKVAQLLGKIMKGGKKNEKNN